MMSRIIKGDVDSLGASINNQEIILPQVLALNSFKDKTNVLAILKNGLSSIIAGIKAGLQDKKKLVPAFVLGGIWVVLTLLPALNINPFPLKIMSWLTFAQGGIGGNIINKIGGIIGKGFFAYLLNSIIFDKGLIAKVADGFNVMKKNLNTNQILNPLFLFGMSMSLIIYNVIVKETTLINSMAGLTFLILSLKALANSNGLLANIFSSILGKAQINDNLTIVMTGWTAGFGIGIVVSTLAIANAGYLLAGLTLIGSLALLILLKTRAGVKKA